MTDASVSHDAPTDETSATLLSRVRLQNPEAWERLVYLYAPLVYRWCRQAGLQEAAASDVGQEVFRSVFRAIGGFEHRPGVASFRGWLKTITKRKICDYRRGMGPDGGEGGSDAQAKLMAIPEDAGDDSDAPADPSERMILLRRAVDLVLDKVSEINRQAFLRTVVQEQPAAEVARDLDISLNQVYLAKSRIKKLIRTEFEGLIEE